MAQPYPPPPPPSGSGRSTTAIVVAVVLVMVAGIVGIGLVGLAAYVYLRDRDEGGSAGSAPPSPSATVPEPTAPADLSEFYDQELGWRDCGGQECARLTVPLDYDDPDGRTIRLAVLRVQATDRGNRVGQLVVNPGGPGGSGVQYAAAAGFVFGETVTRYFDVVGFDPRGVGSSTPLECMGTEQTDELVAADPDPDNVREARQLDAMIRAFGEGCLRESGDLARHMSTVEVAKDMDILRAALGERQLDYFGASYGTLIGATYADLFPRNVRRMVLDGAIDPSLSNEELNLGQARGFETALRAYLESCIDAGCPLGNSVDEAARGLRRFLDRVDAEPLETSDERDLTSGLAPLGVWMPLYVQEYWPQLTAALKQAIDGDDGSGLLRLADQYTSRGPDKYLDNSLEALYAVNCLDHSDSIPTRQVPRHFAEFEEASPTFGRSFAYSLSTCSVWPVKSGSNTEAMAAVGAPPIVVIGTTRDPATPYEWAEALAGQLDSGVLISRDGDGHTGFNQGNQCVDSAVERYLVRGVPPKSDLDC